MQLDTADFAAATHAHHAKTLLAPLTSCFCLLVDTCFAISVAVMPVALVTGVTGQDGSYLTELLLDKGYTVHGKFMQIAFCH